MLARVARPGELAGKRKHLVGRGGAAAGQLAQQRGRELLFHVRHAAKERPVEQGDAEIGADSDVLIGLQRRLHVRLVEDRSDVHVVAQRGRA